LAISPNSALAHSARANVLRAKAQNLGMQNQCDEAILEYETVLASNPNAIGALLGLANCKFFTGSIEDAVPVTEQAILLSLTIRISGFRISSSGARVWCNRGLTRRSAGSKRRVTPIRHTPKSASSSLLAMASKARPNVPPRNSPKPVGWPAHLRALLARRRDLWGCPTSAPSPHPLFFPAPPTPRSLTI